MTFSSDSLEAEKFAQAQSSRINFAAIAKVCETDSSTIEAIHKEILAQLVTCVRKGMSVRLAYRIGRLEIKNSEISWKYYADEMDKQPVDAGQAGTDSRLSNF